MGLGAILTHSAFSYAWVVGSSDPRVPVVVVEARTRDEAMALLHRYYGPRRVLVRSTGATRDDPGAAWWGEEWTIGRAAVHRATDMDSARASALLGETWLSG